MVLLLSFLVLALAIALAVGLNFVSIIRRRNLYSAIPAPKSLKCHWLLGHIPEFRNCKEYVLKRLKDLEEDNPGLQKILLGPYVYISIVHPKHLQVILKEPKSSSMYKLFYPWLGDGLIMTKGEKWHRNRKLLTPAFHLSILKGYCSVYNKCVHQLSSKWHERANRGRPVKLFQDISYMSLDILLQCAFSLNSNCQVEGRHSQYVDDCCKLGKLITERLLNPIYTLEWIYWQTPHGRKMKKQCKIVHDHAQKVIEERRAVLANHNESVDCEKKNYDFLDILLMARDEEGRGMSNLEIRNEVDTFMFAGHDTTTSGMSWTLYCLAQHPEHQEKIREEVRSVLKDRECLEYEDLKHLNYTTWCIKEAMRLYPPAHGFTRTNEEELHIGEYVIPKHTDLSISVYQIHRNPAVWENPSKFDPLRFQPGNIEKHGPYDYIPFSAGNRNCIGQNFAMNEMKIAIGTLVAELEFNLDSSHLVDIQPALVLKAENDIKLILTTIN